MNKTDKYIMDVMVNAAISGLCRDGQLEIGVQEARQFHRDKSEKELYVLVRNLYEISIEEL